MPITRKEVSFGLPSGRWNYAMGRSIIMDGQVDRAIISPMRDRIASWSDVRELVSFPSISTQTVTSSKDTLSPKVSITGRIDIAAGQAFSSSGGREQ